MEIEKIKSVIIPILESQNLFLVDLKISKDNVIEIFVDAMQGVNIQTCIQVSREIEARFDREEEDFELTVSSAGIGYPFKVDGQYQKNIGRTVEIKFKNNTKLQGILKAFDEKSVCIEYEEKKAMEGSKKKQVVKTEKTLEREEIKEIKDVVTF